MIGPNLLAIPKCALPFWVNLFLKPTTVEVRKTPPGME